MRAALLLALLLAVPAAHAEVLLVGLVPDLPGPAAGDAVAVAAVGEPADLGGLRLTDGEDTVELPARVLAAGEVLWLVGAADLADWQAHGGPAALTLAASLRLGNDGDDVALLAADGRVLDAVAYGERGPDGVLPSGSAGTVLQRDRLAGRWTDTDAPADWVTPRQHRIGESALDAPTFQADAVTLYASPDSSFEVLTDVIASATTRLHLHVYELRSAELVDHLVAAKQTHPALDLQVLVDSNPVGQTSDERHATADALRRVTQAGGHAVLAGNGRYDDHHLKVLVADDAVAVQSENWVPSGVPVDPSTGNRGWGAVVEGGGMADWFAGWLAADRAAWDTTAFDLATYDPTFEAPPRRAPRTGEHGPLVAPLRIAGPVPVTPLVSPDHTQDPRSDPVAALLDGATSRVRAQQLDLALTARNRLGWQSDDPWTQALAAAAARGVDVQVQAAAPFASTDDGNGPELAWLAARGVDASVLDRPGLGTLHNKAFAVDDRLVVLGSTNGNHHSRSANREVSLVVASPEAAAWGHRLMDADRKPSGPGRDWGVPGEDLRAVPAAPWPTLFALVWVASVLARRCRSSPSP